MSPISHHRPMIIALTLLTAVALLLSSAAPAGAATRIKLVINGVTVPSDVAPTVQNGRVMVPIRVISEYLGAQVSYEAKTKTVTVALNGTTVTLRIGDKKAYINKALVTLDVAATAPGGHTIVPLRFIGQALGATVNWDSKTSTVTIRRDGTITDIRYDKGPGQAYPFLHAA